MTLFNKYTKFLDIVSKLVELILIILIGTGVIVVLIEVVGRWVGIVPPWTDEYARYSMVWTGMIGSALLVRTNSHISVDIFLLAFGNNTKRFAEWFTVLMTVLVGFLFTYYGVFVTLKNLGQISPGLNMSFAYVYLCLPISGILFILYSVERTVLLYTARQ